MAEGVRGARASAGSRGRCAGMALAVALGGLAGCSSREEKAEGTAVAGGIAGIAGIVGADGSAGGAGTAAAPVELTGQPLSTAEIVARCEPSVALIKGRTSTGSGFLIGPGLVATNSHVIDGEFVEGLEVRFPSAEGANKGPFAAELLTDDASRDLALLSVKTDLPPLVLADGYRFRKGEDVTVIGNPGLGDGSMVLENAISRGVMSTKARLDGNDFYQLHIAINPGNSGGPVFESTGRVVGVATLKASKQESVAFCIPEDAVRTAMERVRGRGRAESDAAQGRHRAVAAFTRLSVGGALLALALDIGRLERQSGQTLQIEADGKTLNGQEFAAKLVEIDGKLSDGLAPAASRVASDGGLDAAARSGIGEMMVNHDAMRAAIGQAPDKGRVDAMKATHRRLIEEGKAALPVAIPSSLMVAFEDHDPSQSLGAFAGSPRFGMGPGGLHARMLEHRQQVMQRQQEVHNRMDEMRSRMMQRRMGRR